MLEIVRILFELRVVYMHGLVEVSVLVEIF